MHKDGYYSSGEFAKKSNVSVRTIRYYDQQNILKPSLLTDEGVRFYTDSDFTRLQQILLLKYLGFTLDDIRNMTIGDSDYHVLKNSLELQKRMNQYINAGNISARINLHNRFSVNKQGWFPWVYEQCGIVKGMRILEIGCGDGTLWVDNIGQLAMTGKRNEFSGKKKNIYIELTDISEGMISDARRNIKKATESWKERDIDVSFRFRVASCEKTGAKDESYDLVIANHVLFYCKNVNKALDEIVRVLKPGGVLVCSTYGSRHMQEISRLVSGYDKRIALEADKLFEKFGLDNGDKILKKHFSDVERRDYKDALVVDEAEPLVDYILSCHGNQKEYLVDKYTDFKKYVEKKLVKPMTITKEAGVFVCRK